MKKRKQNKINFITFLDKQLFLFSEINDTAPFYTPKIIEFLDNKINLNYSLLFSAWDFLYELNEENL